MGFAQLRSRSLVAAWSFLLLLPHVTRAQTPEDYRRADAVSSEALAPYLADLWAEIHWVKGAPALWYATTGRGEARFVRVDGRTSKSAPLFDDQRLAEVVGAAPGQITVLDVEARRPAWRVRIEAAGKEGWCDVEAYRCELTEGSPDRPDELTSPDRRLGLFRRENDLWVRVRKTGAETRLTNDGVADFGYGAQTCESESRLVVQAGTVPPENVTWSPDSRWALGSRLDLRAVLPYPYVEWAPRDGSFRPIAHSLRLPLLGDPKPPSLTFLTDVAGRSTRPVRFPPGLQYLQTVTWDLDGQRAFVVATSPDLLTGALVEIDLKTAAGRVVVQERTAFPFEFNLFMDKPPMPQVIAQGREALWFSQRSGRGHLYLYDVTTGREKRALTAGEWNVLDVVGVDEASRRVIIVGSGREPGRDPYYRMLYSVPLDGGPPLLLTPEDAEHGVLLRPSDLFGGEPARERVGALSPDGSLVVEVTSTVSRPAESHLRSTIDGRILAVIARADAVAIGAAGWRPPERFTVKAADGVTDIWGVIHFPPGYRQDGRFPVIDVVYGGPQAIEAPRSYGQAVLGQGGYRGSLAELGFVVVSVDGRGTPGRSTAFRRQPDANFADPQVADHVATLRQLRQRFGGIDLDRVGVFGHSFGGYLAMHAILARPDIFKVAVASAGPHRYESLYSGQDVYFGPPDYGGSSIRPSATARSAAYAAIDQVPLADRLQGKLLLAYGGLDENVPQGGIVPMIEALEKAGKTFDLVYLPNANHGYAYTSAYFRKRLFDYFVEHLGGRDARREQ